MKSNDIQLNKMKRSEMTCSDIEPIISTMALYLDDALTHPVAIYLISCQIGDFCLANA